MGFETSPQAEKEGRVGAVTKEILYCTVHTIHDPQTILWKGYLKLKLSSYPMLDTSTLICFVSIEIYFPKYTVPGRPSFAPHFRTMFA